MKFRLATACAIVTLSIAACSGGGGSSPNPRPTSTVPGVGYSGAFSAKVTFSIDVPSEAAAAAYRRRLGKIRTAALAAASSSTPTAQPSGTPYVSPLVGSIQITPIAVDGASLAISQPPSVFSGACSPAGSGCTITATVPAASGAVDRYFIQTYASAPVGSGGTGTLISSGYVDVAVPASGTGAASIGGTVPVTLGGYVASLKFSPGSASFVDGTATALKVIVEAVDAAGAIIIGNTYYAIPVTVETSETKSFTIDGESTLTVSGPGDEQIDVGYSGANSLGTVLTATSTDSNGDPVMARLPIPVTTPATPSPSPTPTAAPTKPGSSPTPSPTPTPLPSPLSIYAIDANNDNIVEYDVVNRLIAKIPVPSATPRRVLQFAPGSNVTCNSSEPPLLGYIGGLIADTGGRVLFQTSCNDGTSTYVYAFGPADVGTPVPSVFGLEASGFVGYGSSAAASPTTDFFSFFGPGYTNTTYSFTPSGAFVAQYFSNECASELGQAAACTTEPGPGSYTQNGASAADPAGNLYMSGSYYDNVVSSPPPVPVTPPGPGSAPTISQPPVVSIYGSTTGVQPALLPQVDIAGMLSDLGGSGEPDVPAGLAVDGSTLYVLAAGGGNPLQLLSGAVFFPGLSSCPPPSSAAPVDAPGGGATKCSDGALHSYLVGFDISDVLSVANFGLDVELKPKFLIGGDVVGRFGENQPLEFAASAQEIAAKNGIVAIANVSSASASEIDVYNTNGVTGSHTDIAPVLVIPNVTSSGTGTLYQGVAIGPSGSATGGQSLLLRRNPHVGHRRFVRPPHRR